MGIAREFWMRCRAWLGRKKHEQDLDDDVQAHVELATEENMQRGMSSNEARRAALRAFGGVTQTKEAYRIQRGVPFVETLWRDVRYALRRLGKSPAFTAIVVVTLALGIGANTAIFTLVQGIMLRSLPVADPSQLVRIGDRTHCCYFDGFESDDGDFDLFSYDLYKRFRDAAPEFDELAAVQAGGSGFSVRWGAEPAKALRTEFVSGNYFGTLGVGAYAGRLLSPRDNLRGAAPVVVLSDAAWHTEFGGDTGVVGSTVYLQGHAFTVVGIAPPGFYGDRIQPFPPDMWMPLETEPLMEGDNSSLLQPTTAWLYAIGRLHEGANRKALQSKLSEVLRQWMKAQPSFMKNGNEAQIVRQHVVLSAAGGGIQKIQQQTGKGLWVLMLLSSVVLLIACANIANLLLARAMAQRGAIAIRVGLGATRGRVIRQMVTESLLLSLMGGVAGLAIAFFGARAILVLAFPVSQELPVSARPSWEVLLFALGVSVVTGLLFSCVPAWIASGAQPAEATRASRGATGDSSSLPQRALLVFQLALSIVLLSTAMLATRSLFNLEHQNTGFETEGRYTVDLDLKGSGFKPEGLPGAYRAMEDALKALPGARHVSFARYLPLEGNEWGSCVTVQGHPAPNPNDTCFADWDRVSAEFLDSIGVHVTRGRGFTGSDEGGTVPVALVNEAFVKRFFPRENPIGKHFGVNGVQYSDSFEIVGVTQDFKLTDAREDAQPMFLRPMGQRYTGYKKPEEQGAEESSLYLNRMIVQFDRPQTNAEQIIRGAITGVDRNILVIHVRDYPYVVAANFNDDRLIARLTEAFGLLALVLASVGLYGVMSYTAVRRTGEIGIRMALGASRPRIVSLMARSALTQVIAGVAIGLPVSLLAGRLMGRMLYEVHADDPLALTGAVAALAACVSIAALVPAIRAASIDPMDALRAE